MAGKLVQKVSKGAKIRNRYNQVLKKHTHTIWLLLKVPNTFAADNKFCETFNTACLQIIYMEYQLSLVSLLT